MRVTAIEPQARAAERVNVFVDGEFRCGAPLELVLAEGIRTGDDISGEQLERIEREDRIWKAREAGLRLLAQRARSREELRRRLVRKEFQPDEVDAALARLDAAGLIDDAAFAGAFARDRVRLKPRGTRRVLEELRQKGVTGSMAEQAVENALSAESTSEADLARRAADAWCRRQQRSRLAPGGKPRDPADHRRRLYAHLARRGFGGEAIRAAADAVLPGLD